MEERSCGLPGEEVGEISFLTTTVSLCLTYTACDGLLRVGNKKSDRSILDAGPANSPGARPASDWELTLGKAHQQASQELGPSSEPTKRPLPHKGCQLLVVKTIALS